RRPLVEELPVPRDAQRAEVGSKGGPGDGDARRRNLASGLGIGGVGGHPEGDGKERRWLDDRVRSGSAAIRERRVRFGLISTDSKSAISSRRQRRERLVTAG